MTRDEVLVVALSLPETESAPHFERTAVKVAKGKIFATLAPDGSSFNVKLTPDQQPVYVESAPEIFSPIPNAWGRQGWTTVSLVAADRDAVLAALTAAWRNAAPKKLLALHTKPD
ncbi:MmcQ/YjbR family DNA-binding protein [Phreatobacter stygius]|uniref:MmcQ/YjbR family DNA-binding protein n=1 Tax=Phreatobacter stygius TaxID=1940610 RepID=A0A4D7AXS7_9HYPH|nr:MmcQ/YjbR family DNA-binding protein [Phreatobacter stygius]QCI64961.1 MmcQ/YjbR family DNA-binding protein [Phreatobacter stygius]